MANEAMHTPTERELLTAQRYARMVKRIGDRLFDAGEMNRASRHWLAAGYIEGWLSVAADLGVVRRSLRDSRRVAF